MKITNPKEAIGKLVAFDDDTSCCVAFVKDNRKANSTKGEEDVLIVTDLVVRGAAGEFKFNGERILWWWSVKDAEYYNVTDGNIDLTNDDIDAWFAAVLGDDGKCNSKSLILRNENMKKYIMRQLKNESQN
jgi:hypothetical protein